ncbi:hypothetical protein [Sporosarcina sp. Marseille-Q4943]|nr:hypothetical protein [Sporosarcina sp. Marseille-Q4943]
MVPSVESLAGFSTGAGIVLFIAFLLTASAYGVMLFSYGIGVLIMNRRM